MPDARINTERARQALQEFRFGDLFVDVLGWNNPDARASVTLEDEDKNKWTAAEISQLSGFRVFEVVPNDPAIARPTAKNQLILQKALSAQAVENIVIFVDSARTQSLWLWMKRDGKSILPRKHAYIKGQPGDLFLSKLSALVVDLSELDEEGNLPITEAANRVRAALDVEVVTKAFFKRFQDEHAVFLEEISGIDDEAERRWYASVVLNRLMFIWFLQKKGFVDRAERPDGNRNYLRDRLVASAKTKDRFFSHFLRDLFFEGFAKPEGKSKPIGNVPLGDIPYLNGGLFLPHGIEQRIEGDTLLHGPFKRIRIPDSAFKSIFQLFDSYSWSLNDVPGGDDREINPAVLGYIFEKYINQKEFGAYYTRPEITEYLCEQTIHQLVIDAANKHIAGQRLLVKHGLKKEAPAVEFESVGDVLLRADGSLCRELLQTFLPQISILDPACGSGAFLVAALKTLLAIYTGLLGRAEAVQEKAVLQWVEIEKKKHKAPVAYWLKKKIITENLFGVDIMEEAVEIAKLRLFLALVASAERRDHLEPLPNIEFNLMHGNSLIGLLHVDPKKFDSSLPGGAQGRITLRHEPTDKDLGFTVESKTAPTAKEKVGAHLAEKRARKYDELLREKNRLIDNYKKAALDFEDLTALKDSIEAKKREAREILDKLLLGEFLGLGIQFEKATWDATNGREGSPEKRRLAITDIESLKPFHWAYEFDEIIVNRGGFDAIITNPPWDVFEKSDKEFFRNYEPTIQKNKLRLEEWVEQREQFLNKKEIREAWLDYLSTYPHQAQWFKAAPQYHNQTSIIEGRIAASKNDFYKLFLEQTVNLLKKGGRCGAVIAGGFYNNKGAAQIRRMLFEATSITSLIGFENRKRIFEGVDARFKFFVVTFRRNGPTKEFDAAFMRLDVAELDAFPCSAGSVRVTYQSIAKYTPETLQLIEFRSPTDAEIFAKLTRHPVFRPVAAGHQFPSLHYELNLTLDHNLFERTPGRGRLPLVEGKVFHQFDDHWERPRYWVREKEARAQLLNTRRRVLKAIVQEAELPINVDGLPVELGCDSYRLALRDVASNTNERTVIATILPRNVLCPHTVALERVYEPYIDAGGQLHANYCPLTNHERCAYATLFNSFVVDYLARLQVTTHLSFFYVYNLTLPRLRPESVQSRTLVQHGARLVGTTAEFDDLLKDVFGPQANHRSHGITNASERAKLRAEIDAIVAQLYDLTDNEFAHILSTFPLVPQEVKTATLNTFIATSPSADDKAVQKLIKALETDKVELKEAAAFSVQRNQKSPDVIQKIVREIAAFLNTGGGNVIIGVTDAGKVVGIAKDIQHANPKKKNHDGYELFLRDSISGKLGTLQSSVCKITFHKIENQEVCRILIPAATAPVYLDGNLIIRDGTSSRTLSTQEAAEYIALHWPQP